MYINTQRLIKHNNYVPINILNQNSVLHIAYGSMDIIEFKNPKVLFIKDIFIKDCVPVDDLFDEKIMDQLEDPIKINMYTPLPRLFYDMKRWVKKTDLKCFYCDRNFNKVPVFIPKTIEPGRESYIMVTEGCFCSFNCAVSYIDIYYPKIHDNLNKKNMLKLLYKVFTGRTISEIPKAPLKYKLIQYGGNLSNQEYESLLGDLSDPKRFKIV